MTGKEVTVTMLCSLLALVASCLPAPAADANKLTNEEHWIVNSIGSDIAGIVAFAAQKSTESKPDLGTILCKTTEGDATTFQYDLIYQGADNSPSSSITLKRYIWNPDNYAPWASDLISRFHLKRVTANSSADRATALISDLSNFSWDVLNTQNKSVSAALTANPLDPELHEEAALLCATLALRECAACFSDVRPQLNRLVAHLAIARALRGTEDCGDAGKLAEIVLCCLGGREAESTDLIKPLASRTTDGAMQSWLRAIQIRSTLDFRLANIKSGSKIERLEYGRALSEELSADALTDYVKENDQDNSDIEWLRYGYRGLKSVEAGHLYAEPGLKAELGAFLHDYMSTHDGAKPQNQLELIDQLNLECTGCLVSTPQWQLQAISWANLAGFHNRHILDSIFQQYIFELWMWGVKDQAQATLAGSEQAFSKLKLFPLCQLDMVAQDTNVLLPQEKVADELLPLQIGSIMVQHPQWLTFELWNIAKDGIKPLPSPTDFWFRPRFLFGTCFDYQSRSDKDKVTIDELQQLRTLAPHDRIVLLDLVKMKYKDPTGDQLAEGVGQFADYDLSIMKAIADADYNNRDKYVARLEKMVKFQPNTYFQLGHYLADTDPERAAKAYEQGIKLCRDDVVKSNNSDWLANYYFDHGEKDKAMALAQEAADVYSSRGLQALAGLYEKMDRLTDAEGVYKQVEERYQSDDCLFPFYFRHQNDKPEYKTKMEELGKVLYKHGFVKCTKEDLLQPPKYGGKVKSASDLAKSYGINDGCIVISVDGYRIANIKELTRNRDLNPRSKEVEIILWDGKQYHTIKGSPPHKRYNFDLEPWEAK